MRRLGTHSRPRAARAAGLRCWCPGCLAHAALGGGTPARVAVASAQEGGRGGSDGGRRVVGSDGGTVSGGASGEATGSASASTSGSEDKSEGDTSSHGSSSDPASLPPATRLALGALRWYKSQVSPLLPRSCRYVPSCSEYSVDAYTAYGVWRGTLLTAWRLGRCNPTPLAGDGFFDPVRVAAERWWPHDSRAGAGAEAQARQRGSAELRLQPGDWVGVCAIAGSFVLSCNLVLTGQL